MRRLALPDPSRGIREPTRTRNASPTTPHHLACDPEITLRGPEAHPVVVPHRLDYLGKSNESNKLAVEERTGTAIRSAGTRALPGLNVMAQTGGGLPCVSQLLQSVACTEGGGKVHHGAGWAGLTSGSGWTHDPHARSLCIRARIPAVDRTSLPGICLHVHADPGVENGCRDKKKAQTCAARVDCGASARRVDCRRLADRVRAHTPGAEGRSGAASMFAFRPRKTGCGSR